MQYNKRSACKFSMVGMVEWEERKKYTYIKCALGNGKNREQICWWDGRKYYVYISRGIIGFSFWIMQMKQ